MIMFTHPIRVALATVLVTAGALAIARADQPPRHRPPQEAFDACKGASVGDSCEVSHHDHTMTGTCQAAPDGITTELACRPDHPPGPPPEAFAACTSRKAGDACTVTFGDHTMTGTCDAGPDGNGTLACHPGGPPPR